MRFCAGEHSAHCQVRMAAAPSGVRTKISRTPQRGTKDREVANGILDDEVLCHVSYVREIDGELEPTTIPTLYARVGDELLIHGHSSMGITKAVKDGRRLVVSVAHNDGYALCNAVRFCRI